MVFQRRESRWWGFGCDTISRMNHRDHVDLLRPGKLSPGESFADLGAGSGAFTLALREVLGPDANLVAVDRDGVKLKSLELAHRSMFGGVENLRLIQGDFMRDLDLPPLGGILMANALHFFKDRITVLRRVADFLEPGGVLIVVEYNTDRGNTWVPHPLSFDTFHNLALRSGFGEPTLLAVKPSSFLGEFYSALAKKV